VSVNPYKLDKKLESIIMLLIKNTIDSNKANAIEKKYAAEIEAHFGGPKQMKI